MSMSVSSRAEDAPPRFEQPSLFGPVHLLIGDNQRYSRLAASHESIRLFRLTTDNALLWDGAPLQLDDVGLSAAGNGKPHPEPACLVESPCTELVLNTM